VHPHLQMHWQYPQKTQFLEDLVEAGGAAEGMTGVSLVEEDGLTISVEGVGSSSWKDRVFSPLLGDPTSSSSITTLIDSITVHVLLLNTL
jgi:hypothetical protein